MVWLGRRGRYRASIESIAAHNLLMHTTLFVACVLSSIPPPFSRIACATINLPAQNDLLLEQWHIGQDHQNECKKHACRDASGDDRSMIRRSRMRKCILTSNPHSGVLMMIGAGGPSGQVESS